MGAPAFIDEAEITVVGGNGGDGIVSFLREKFKPHGGPNGGDGGRGGNVIAAVAENVNTLAEFRRHRRLTAKNGGRGRGGKCHGADAEDVYVSVPAGTKIIDAVTRRQHADLTAAAARAVLAFGGRGGLGNNRFKSSVNRAPRFCTSGQSGETRRFILELHLLADVGLLGMPNAGKSTFLRAVSKARPKVGDYPFTTLAPHLGYVAAEDGNGITIADIPGVIRGAAAGAGLGNRFLRHLSRTRLLCQVVDATAANPSDDCRALLDELARAGNHLSGKPKWLLINKIDALPPQRRPASELQDCRAHFEKTFALSALTGEGVAPLVGALLDYHEKTTD